VAYIIACLIEKGGVGKTTTTVNLGAALALRGKRILLIDFDPQAHTTKWFGLERPPEETIFDVVQKPEAGLRRAITPTTFPNIDIICGARALGMADRLFSMTTEGTARNPTAVLRRALRDMPSEYDLVIIDCPPSVGLLNLNAIAVANELLIPIEPGDLAYDGLGQIALTLGQLIEEEMISKIPELSILFVRIDPRLRSARKLTDRIGGAADRPYTMFERTIRKRDIVCSLPDQKKTVFEVPGASDIAEDYAAVAEELLQRLSLTPNTLNEKDSSPPIIRSDDRRLAKDAV
jgi:chromosome partitioning protein